MQITAYTGIWRGKGGWSQEDGGNGEDKGGSAAHRLLS